MRPGYQRAHTLMHLRDHRYNADAMWDGSQYGGASVAAMAKLGSLHG